jgi:hypothetical protein
MAIGDSILGWSPGFGPAQPSSLIFLKIGQTGIVTVT